MAAEWERRGLSVRGPSDSEVAAALAEWASPAFESGAADAQEVEDDEVGPGVGVESEESGDEGEALDVDVADLEDVEAGEEAFDKTRRSSGAGPTNGDLEQLQVVNIG